MKKLLTLCLMSIMLVVITTSVANSQIAIKATDYTVTLNSTTGDMSTNDLPSNWTITGFTLVDNPNNSSVGKTAKCVIYYYDGTNSTKQLTLGDKNFDYSAISNVKYFKLTNGSYFSTITITGTRPAILLTSLSVSPTTSTLTSKGATLQLSTTVAPDNADDKTVKWTSSNTAVATVNSSGLVTAVSKGSATITTIANDASGKTATCNITVNISGTAVNEVDILNLRVYPNPCTDYFQIDNMDSKVFTIMDMNGKTVLSSIVKSKNDVSNLKQGLYILRIGEYQAKICKR